MIAILASILSPFFVDVVPEVRTTYVSLGKLLEDRPMQTTSIRAGWDSGAFGRFGVRNWDVSSLTDRRADDHRHFLYHTEFGPTWQYDWKVVKDWTLKSDLTRSWTIYDGFESSSANKTYHWWQLDQSLENQYLVPFYRLRHAFRTSNYLYFKFGVRRRISFLESFYLTPSVFVEGGDGRNFKRVFGNNINDATWGYGGIASISFRLEGGWSFSSWGTLYAYVEQYDAVGGAARDTNAVSSYASAHNDWTYGGIGVRMSF